MRFLCSIVQALLVPFLTFVFLANWPVYTPEEITELQKVPLILQGGTDYGGSNMFAAYVFGHIFFGILACLSLTLLLNKSASPSNIRSFLSSRFVMTGYVAMFLCANLYFIVGGVALLLLGVDDLHLNYFICDYVQVFVLISLTYLLSYFLIVALSSSNLRLGAKCLLSPIFFVIFVMVGSTGITPKAGQILQSYQIPEYRPNSLRHRILLPIHDLCLKCTGFEREP